MTDIAEAAEARRELETLAGKHHKLTGDDYRRAFQLAFRALSIQDGMIARLKGELDGYQGHQVFFATEAHAIAIAAGSTEVSQPVSPEDGTVLRATDTGREWVYRDHAWSDR